MWDSSVLVFTSWSLKKQILPELDHQDWQRVKSRWRMLRIQNFWHVVVVWQIPVRKKRHQFFKLSMEWKVPLHKTYCSISRRFFSFTRKLIKRGLRRSYVWILEIWIGERVLHREGPRDYWSNIWLQHKIIPIALQIVFALDRIAFHHEISRIYHILCLRHWTCPNLTNVHPMVEWRHCFGECLKYPWYLVYIRRIFGKLRPNTHIKIKKPYILPIHDRWIQPNCSSNAPWILWSLPMFAIENHLSTAKSKNK